MKGGWPIQEYLRKGKVDYNQVIIDTLHKTIVDSVCESMGGVLGTFFNVKFNRNNYKKADEMGMSVDLRFNLQKKIWIKNKCLNY